MTFGEMLKDWRRRRRLSQLALSLVAGVSARHVAFLETGRAQPSRPMVLRLCEALEIPREARNALLHAGGFAAAYKARALDNAELSLLSDGIAWMIQRHDPYPAIVIDKLWRLKDANRTARMLLSAYGVSDGDSLLDAVFSANTGREMFANWPELGHHMARRLRTESAHLGGIAQLDAHATAFESDPDVAAYVPPGDLPPVVPAQYRAGRQILSLYTTIAQFGSAEDITLADLRIELMFPANIETRTWLEAMAPERA